MRIGIDIGGTKTEVIALDEMGKCLLRRRVGTPADDYSAMLQTIVELVVSAGKHMFCWSWNPRGNFTTDRCRTKD